MEVLVFAWTNIVTHLVKEFALSQNFSALILFNFSSASHVYCTSWETEPFVHQNRSQDSTLISVLLNAVLTVPH